MVDPQHHNIMPATRATASPICYSRPARSSARSRPQPRYRCGAPICLCPWVCCSGTRPRSRYRWGKSTCQSQTCFRTTRQRTSCRWPRRRRCPVRVFFHYATCRSRYLCWGRRTSPPLLFFPPSTRHNTRSYRHRPLFQFHLSNYF